MNIDDLCLIPGDLWSFNFKSPEGVKWDWVGNFQYMIPGGETIPMAQVVSIYGAPQVDEDGWYTKSARRSSEASHRRGDVDHREQDFLNILRRYERWQTCKANRYIFKKPNGSIVMIPNLWVCRGSLKIYFWEPFHQEWLPLVSQ